MISIIIPTLDEAENIRATVSSISDFENHEVIVVDGGSSDETVAIAQSMGVKTLCSKPGRARQMNLGAKNSRNDILLFLHGDTVLPADFAVQVEIILAQQNTSAGAFKLLIDLSGLGARIIEKTVEWRSQIWQLPYGDQAIFIKKALFEQAGGYGKELFLEDYIFIKRLRKFGKIRLATSGIITSGRRWQHLGLLKTTLINQAVIIGYLLGFSLTTLKKLYGIAKKG